MRMTRWKISGIGFAIVFLYVLGVAVRTHFELKISVRNETQLPIRPTLRLNGAGDDIALGELAPGRRVRNFIQLGRGEADIDLELVEPGGRLLRKNVIGYTEGGYCGNVEVTVHSDFQVTSTGEAEQIVCFGSWLDFF